MSTNPMPAGLHCRHVDDSERRKWQEPESILRYIGLEPGQTFVDVGCGEGYFALPAARLVGEKGQVYALDRDPSAVAVLAGKARAEGLVNLVLKAARAEDSVPCRGCADIVFFGIVLHDFEDPARVLANAREMIKPSGRLIDLDWRKEPAPFGPPLHIRFSEEQAKSLIEKAGFKVETVSQSGTYHYLIIARPELPSRQPS